MNKKLFQNDSITGNSLIGFEIKGTFKKETAFFKNHKKSS